MGRGLISGRVTSPELEAAGALATWSLQKRQGRTLPRHALGPKMGAGLSDNQTNVTRHTADLGQSVAELTGRQEFFIPRATQTRRRRCYSARHRWQLLTPALRYLGFIILFVNM